MAAIVTDDGVTLHAEEAGQGEPLIFIHEFAGDHRSWEPQIRFFSAAYHCVTYAARGYPPSDVPTDPAAYSQARAGLAVLPRTGHTANLEEPDVFNRVVDRFLGAVARGAWHPRDPRSVCDPTMRLH
jgi:pimeloyl-ACP methyl ester carboxylesterase